MESKMEYNPWNNGLYAQAAGRADRHKKMRWIGAKIAIVAIVTIGFIWLAVYSYQQRPAVNNEIGYTPAQIERLNNMVVHTLQWRQAVKKEIIRRQADALQDLWHITENEINQPINLWGEK